MIHQDDKYIIKDSLSHLEDYDEIELEYRQLTKKGDYRWISNHVSIIKDAEGRPLYRNGTFAISLKVKKRKKG